MRSLLLLLLLTGCAAKIQYLDDPGYVSSGQSNSPEYPVVVNGYLCKDITGNPGLCSLRVKSKRDVVVQLFEQQYDYRLAITCSRELEADFTVDVKKNSQYNFILAHEKFEHLKSFICVGDVFPLDRLDKVEMKFEFRVKVVPDNYQARENFKLYRKGSKLVAQPGIHALYTNLHFDNEWHHYSKQTEIEVPHEDIWGWSESYQGRLNFYGSSGF